MPPFIGALSADYAAAVVCRAYADAAFAVDL